MNETRSGIENWLATVHLTTEWQQFENACKDQYRNKNWDWKCSPWARIIDGKKVAVVLCHEGETHNTWRLFIDGKYVRHMNEVNICFGSAGKAMQIAESEFAGAA